MTMRRFVSRSVRLGFLIAGLFAGPADSVVLAQSIVSSTIDGTGPAVTPPGWDAFAGYSYWGPLNTVITAEPTFGQTFTPPAGATALHSVTFKIHTNGYGFGFSHPTTFSYRAFVYEWSGVGLVGAALFTSPLLTMTTGVDWQTIWVDTGNTAVTPGQQYVVFLSTLGATPVDTLDVRATWGAMQLANSNAYSGGGGTWSRNNVTWFDLPGDLAFALTFATAPPTNTPPTADAGDDQSSRPGLPVQLNGSGSFDDNTPTNELLYDWSFVSLPVGSTVALSGPTTITPSFTPDLAGTYVVQLVVTDQGALSSAPSQITIGENPPPTANAGPDQLVIVGTVVTLSGSGADADGEPITYAWSLTAPADSAALLYAATSSETTFLADRPGVYSAHLTVSDPLGPGEPDAVQITATTASGYAQILIKAAADRILGLSADAVTNRGNQNALMRFLSNAIVALQSDDVDAARQQIEQAILRTDGCAIGGMPDGNGPSRDWITACDAQNQVFPALADALAAIAP
jgi:hypothetical protein